MKPLGYYLNLCSIDHAGQLEELLESLHQTDQLGVIEWLTHTLKEDFRRIDADLSRFEELKELEADLNRRESHES